MADVKETIRCRVLRGFLIDIGRHAVEGDVIDLPRPQFIFMKGANAVVEEPISADPEVAAGDTTDTKSAADSAEGADVAASTKKGKAS